MNEKELGLGVTNLTQSLAYQLKLSATEDAVLVVEVLPGSSAEAANLHAGDLLLSINDQVVRSATDAAQQIQQARRRGATQVELLIQHARERRRLPLCFN
jgi:S1-C subfamily serine protease